MSVFIAPPVNSFGYNYAMKSLSLAESNPYLKGRRSLRDAFVQTVVSSTAIEGVHLTLSPSKAKSSRTKQRASGTQAKSSR